MLTKKEPGHTPTHHYYCEILLSSLQ